MDPSQDTCFFPRLAASGWHFRIAAHTPAPNWGPKWGPFLRESFLLGALVPTAAGSSLIFMVWRAKAGPKCTSLVTFCCMPEVPKQQLPSQILSPLMIYLKSLWECTRSTLQTNASCSRISWTVRLKHNVTLNMIGIPCDTLRRLGCMLLCK